VFRLIEALAQGDGKTVVETSEALRLHGLSAAAALEEMSMVLQRMAVLQAVPSSSDGTDEEAQTIARLADLMPADETQLLYSMCLHGRTELGLAPDEYAALTMVLLRLLAFKPGAAEKKTLNRVAGGVAPQPTTPPAPLQRPTAPPGQVLPVVEPRQAPPRTGAPTRPGNNDVMGVPVRVQPEPLRETPSAAPAVVPTPEGDFWQETVQQLVEREAISALVRELALQAQLVGRDEGHWMLRVERESLNQPASRERLKAALQAAGHAVEISVEVGPVTDSPARRNAHAQWQRQQAAEQIILNDPFVQQMQRDFGAKIVPGSIKPTATKH
jgi:DNA polymerase-3 subunit gamma/tau